MTIRNFFATIIFLFIANALLAVDPTTYILSKSSSGSFPLVTNGTAAKLYVSPTDFPGVIRVAGHLQNDIFRVSGTQPELNQTNNISSDAPVVIIGTLGKNELIDQLVASGKIDAEELNGKWEKFIIQNVKNPMPGVKQALVIAGSDKRGTIYGMYDLSDQIGVHPWHFWADIPPKKQSELHVAKGLHTKGEPKVKYRGIFINDEAPALSGWAFEKYGGFNAKFYEHVFELILRMKGNYLWPAMWGRMFYVEDPQNPVLAEEYGIVMGTSHHEPLTRAHAEWARFGEGDWNYNTNPKNLEEFWKKGMERRGDTETIVTIGMRGDGDEPMTEGTAIDLLENIVKKQREIIVETTGKPAADTPQLWALYKEVQDYYDKGMRVPDDVTLLLCDDNWGNIRKLPELTAEPRSGGYGIYYHFDYVGGPRNYKWINTNQIERTWEQMHLAYEYGADRIWIVNVGDIKPMEFPTQFFLDYAWDPEAWNADNLMTYYTLWAKDIFGKEHAQEIGEMVKQYSKFNSRRKPELIDTTTYNLNHYNEANLVVEEYNALADKAEKLAQAIPSELQDAYYQLVLFPIQASANLNKLHISAAKNHLYAQQGRASANDHAQKVSDLFARDAELTKEYHTEVANGKWYHMMSQTHIGYTYWQQPEKNSAPRTYTLDLPQAADMGVTIDGSADWWPNADTKATLSTFDNLNDQTRYITVFNRGQEAFDFNIAADADWVVLSSTKGSVAKETEIGVNIDWEKVPAGSQSSTLTIEGTGKSTSVIINAQKHSAKGISGFVEANGYISMEAAHYTQAVEKDGITWTTIPNLGKTGDGVTALPVAKEPVVPSKNGSRLAYDVHFFSEGEVTVYAYFSPTINYHVGDGLKYGIGFDNEEPQIVNVHQDSSEHNWNISVANNVKIISSTHLVSAGKHTLNFYLANTGLVLQKLVIDTGGVKKTYLGPSESFKK